MKSKDQQLLEEAYKKIQSILRDGKGQHIHNGDIVVYNKVKYKVVGGKSALGTGISHDEVQLEEIGAEEGKIPKLIWTRPKQVVKVK